MASLSQEEIQERLVGMCEEHLRRARSNGSRIKWDMLKTKAVSATSLDDLQQVMAALKDQRSKPRPGCFIRLIDDPAVIETARALYILKNPEAAARGLFPRFDRF